MTATALEAYYIADWKARQAEHHLRSLEIRANPTRSMRRKMRRAATFSGSTAAAIIAANAAAIPAAQAALAEARRKAVEAAQLLLPQQSS